MLRKQNAAGDCALTPPPGPPAKHLAADRPVLANNRGRAARNTSPCCCKLESRSCSVAGVQCGPKMRYSGIASLMAPDARMVGGWDGGRFCYCGGPGSYNELQWKLTGSAGQVPSSRNWSEDQVHDAGTVTPRKPMRGFHECAAAKSKKPL